MAKASKETRRKKVIEVLNTARAMELQAISQYMNQHYNLDDMDYGELAAKIKLIAIDEMRHAEMFAERIKELGGEPVTGHDGKIAKGQKVQGIFPFDAKLEDDTIDVYNQFALVCRDNGDSISLKIFETIIDEETTPAILDQHRQPILDEGAAALTARERELLKLLASGVSSTEDLADQLFISQKTVKNHLASIYDKLAITDRAQAVVEAIRLGINR